FPRELVPQRRRRKILVAGFRGKRARFEVDSGARERQGPSRGNAHRIRPNEKRAYTGWPQDLAGKPGRTIARGCRRLAEGSGGDRQLLQQIWRSPAAGTARR